MPFRVFRCFLVVLAVFAIGCGAKTGLEVPDAGPDGGFDGGPDAGPDAEIPCIELPPDGGLIEVPLELNAELARADVFFLVDNTLSMEQEIDEIRARLRDVISPGITTAIPDSQLGVGIFGDFPEGMCGEPEDVPYQLVQPITDDLNRVQASVDTIVMGSGSDMPESQVEALYQTATGEGIGSYVPPSFGCPMGGVGSPCFRPDAMPVILLFTDAAFHNGPEGTNPYTCPIRAEPHHYLDAVRVLNALDVRVIGLYSGPTRGAARADLVRLATDTNAVDEVGSPLVFDIGMGGEQLGTTVVEAIRTLADVIEFDVDTTLIDPDPGDEVDPRDFVEAVVPVRATPMDRIERIDLPSGSFIGVRAGTRVVFELQLRGTAIVPGPEPQRYLLEIVFRADRRVRLGSRLVEILIPAADGTGCEAR